MQIIVRDNNPIKAFKALSKKLKKDGLFLELRKRRFHQSKGEIKREKLKRAIKRHKKDQEKRHEMWLKKEQQMLIDSKKKARQSKAEYKKDQPYKK